VVRRVRAPQVSRLAADVDRLGRDKIELSALEGYSQRLAGLFEGVAGGLADEVAALAAGLRTEVAAAVRGAEEARARDEVRPCGLCGQGLRSSPC
jgi:hypothetical protein